MLEFQPLTLRDAAKVAPFLSLSRTRLCDYSMGVQFLWREYYNTQFAITEDALYLRLMSPENGGLVFCPPLGRAECPPRECYAPLWDYCAEHKLPLHIALVGKEELPLVLEAFPESEVRSERNWCDYLYHSAQMRDFTGKRYSGQRNHVSRFLRTYPIWHFAPLDTDTLGLARRFAHEFHESAGKNNPLLQEEYKKTLELLQPQIFAGCRQKGGLLFVGDEAVGLSIGEIVKDTLVIHIEKARRDILGAYPMLVNQFARHFAVEGIDYINREEDVGDEGLRTSKLSYHPTELLEKFLVLVP